MRLTTILLFIACLQVAAKSNGQTITLDMKNVPVQKVIKEASRQSGVSIISNEELFVNTALVSINVKNASIEEVLNQCLKNQPFTYVFEGKIIVIKPISTPDLSRGVISPSSFLPPVDIHGRVTDSLGNPLPGVSVTVKGSKTGTSTDANGNFTLYGVSDNATLMVSNVGYADQQIKVKGKTAIVVSLKPKSTSLQEVVVNKGYYNTTQALNTGDVSVVSGADIEKQPVSDPILALEGRVPGLYIQQTTGAPGAYSTIRIMGQNSIANGNDPLYIIDGVPFSSVTLSSPSMGGGAIPLPANNLYNANGGGLSPFNNLNPADIDNIEVLKDADATAIYGSRGANGVVLITTKKGKSGATRLDLNVFTGMGEVTRMMPMLNTTQYLEMRREAFQNDGVPLPDINTNPTDNNYDINGFWDTTRYTNWQKTLIGNAANFTNIQASITGGTANTQFIFGGGYSKQGTVFIGDFSDQKASGRLSMTHTSPDQRFHLQAGVNYVYDNNKVPTTDFTSYLNLAPDAPALYDKNGNVNWATYNGTSTFGNNPTGAILQSSNAVSTNLIANTNLSYQILQGFQVKVNLGYTIENMYQSYLNPSVSLPPPQNIDPNRRSIQFANTKFSTWIIEPQLSYQHKIGPGKLESQIGGTFQQNEYNSLSQYAFGFSSDALITNPTAASYTGYNGSYYTLYRYDAIYGRIGYNVNDEYIINVTARRDGSSRFGPERQFGNFWATGVSWIFSKEKFIRDNLGFLSFGKLRGSYGTTGNDQITDYQFLSTYSPDGVAYEGNSGLYPTQLTNPYFAWEVVKKLQGGIDLGFVKDRVMLNATYYCNRTGNQLVGESLPELTGFQSVEFNLPAVVQNNGMELTLNTINIKSTDFTWSTSANLTIPSNRLVSFPGLANYPAYSSSYIVGKSLFIKRLYHSTGVDSQTGLYTFSTQNANGQPSEPEDWITTEPITQKFYGGINNSFTYKRFQLDVFIQFVKQLGYNTISSFSVPGGFNNYNEPTTVLSRWKSPGDLTNVEQFTQSYGTAYNAYDNLQYSDAIVTDASFIRFKNVALSYSLPDSWKSKLHLQNVKIYLQCQNLFTITHYQGIDPETGGLNLPPLRMITGGLQVNL